jgi:multiple sugar transport system ATP-binding protein
LYDRPDNVFVGAFIGSPSMNLYEGSVALDGGTVTFGAHSFALSPQSLIDRPALRSYDGKPLIIGVRPEDFEDASMVTEPVPENLRLTSKVTLIEALGSEIMVHFRLDAKTVDSGDPDAAEESTSATAANAVGRFHPRSPARMGQMVDIALSAENVHFFDATTRLAIRN